MNPPHTWGKDPPTEPGFWLSGYWDHGRFFIDRWNIDTTLHLPIGAQPNWWWMGPIQFPPKD